MEARVAAFSKNCSNHKSFWSCYSRHYYYRKSPLSDESDITLSDKVQGAGAAEEIAANIEAVNNRSDIDILIVGRGGGSIEDLWCFNEEIVVRAIFESRIPVISSVGHETDTTLADFVADRRAATPTAAAELATPNTKLDLLAWSNDQELRMRNRVTHLIKVQRERVEKLSNSVVFVSQNVSMMDIFRKSIISPGAYKI